MPRHCSKKAGFRSTARSQKRQIPSALTATLSRLTASKLRTQNLSILWWINRRAWFPHLTARVRSFDFVTVKAYRQNLCCSPWQADYRRIGRGFQGRNDPQRRKIAWSRGHPDWRRFDRLQSSAPAGSLPSGQAYVQKTRHNRHRTWPSKNGQFVARFLSQIGRKPIFDRRRAWFDLR